MLKPFKTVTVLWKQLLGMKTHSRVESHDSRVWIETLDFDQVPVPYTSVIVVGSLAGVRGGGAIAGQSPTLFRADAGTPSIDRHSGQWRTQNVTKQPGEGATEGARLGKRNGRSAHVGRRSKKFFKRSRLNIRKEVFSIRVMDKWNVLPVSCMQCTTLNDFTTKFQLELETLNIM